MIERELAEKEAVEKKMTVLGLEDSPYFTGYTYDTAIIGRTFDGRLIYDYEKMIEYLLQKEDFTNFEAAEDWLDYNTLRTIPYMGEKAPLVVQRV